MANRSRAALKMTDPDSRQIRIPSQRQLTRFIPLFILLLSLIASFHLLVLVDAAGWNSCPANTGFNGAAYISGSDRFSTNAIGAIAASQSMCIAFWYLPLSDPGTTSDKEIIPLSFYSDSSPATQNFDLQIGTVSGFGGSGNSVALRLHRYTSSTPYYFPASSADASIGTAVASFKETWHFFTVCLQSGNTFIWLDDGSLTGESFRSSSSAVGILNGLLAQASSKLQFGARVTANARVASGFYDDIRLWTKSGYSGQILTSDMASNYYQFGHWFLPSSPSAAVYTYAYWPVDDEHGSANLKNDVPACGSCDLIGSGQSKMYEYLSSTTRDSNCRIGVYLRDVLYGNPFPYDLSGSPSLALRGSSGASTIYVGESVKFAPIQPSTYTDTNSDIHARVQWDCDPSAFAAYTWTTTRVNFPESYNFSLAVPSSCLPPVGQCSASVTASIVPDSTPGNANEFASASASINLARSIQDLVVRCSATDGSSTVNIDYPVGLTCGTLSATVGVAPSATRCILMAGDSGLPNPAHSGGIQITGCSNSAAKIGPQANTPWSTTTSSWCTVSPSYPTLTFPADGSTYTITLQRLDFNPNFGTAPFLLNTPITPTTTSYQVVSLGMG